MIEAKQRFLSNYQAAANVFLSPNILTYYNNKQQISSENTDFSKLLVQLRVGLGYSCLYPLIALKAWFASTPLAQSK